jgi:hypothetical protein
MLDWFSRHDSNVDYRIQSAGSYRLNEKRVFGFGDNAGRSLAPPALSLSFASAEIVEACEGHDWGYRSGDAAESIIFAHSRLVRWYWVMTGESASDRNGRSPRRTHDGS